jgi:hypothetical protein
MKRQHSELQRVLRIAIGWQLEMCSFHLLVRPHLSLGAHTLDSFLRRRSVLLPHDRVPTTLLFAHRVRYQPSLICAFVSGGQSQ